jgi:predicted aspartyl protease
MSRIRDLAGAGAGDTIQPGTRLNSQWLTQVNEQLSGGVRLYNMRFFASLFLAVLFPMMAGAQSGCPAKVKAIPLRKLNEHQMVVGVQINHSGPYDFLIDTGTQMTVVDQALAADLHLATSGAANVAGVSVQGAARYARLDSLELGDHAAANQGVVVYNMKSVQGAGFALRGLLGEDFLSRYDVLIDRTHSVLCIDDTGAMLESLRGESAYLGQPPSRPPLLPQAAEGFPRRLLQIAVTN